MDNNIKNTNEAQTNLLKKIYAKLHSIKLSKKIPCLAMAALISFSLTACGPTLETTDSTNQPGTSNSQTQGNEELNKYSKLLQNILTNKEYNTLIAKGKADATFYKGGEFQPHPYAFLESQGFDVEEIKNETTPCYTMSYVLEDEPNNLYMYTRIQPTDSYYETYLIRYTLTDQEMNEYEMLHNGYDGKYYAQAVFMNREISKLKTPTIIGQSSIHTNTYKEIANSIAYGGYLGKENSKDIVCDFMLLNPNAENNYLHLKLIPKFDNKSSISHNHYLMEADGHSSTIITFENGIYKGPSHFANMRFDKTADKLNATFYLSQNSTLYNSKNLNNEQ